MAGTALAVMALTSAGDKVKNVLVIGDSISIGYFPFVEKALAPGILALHNPGNGGSTRRGLDSLDSWLKNRKWDLVTFNFGLHDLAYKDEQGRNDLTKGKLSVTPEEYRENLEKIVLRLKKSARNILFVTTTVVPENSAGRKVVDPARYNQIALEVMKKHQVRVLDLYTPSLTIHPATSQPGNVHYSPEGYRLLADELIKTIREILP